MDIVSTGLGRLALLANLHQQKILFDGDILLMRLTQFALKTRDARCAGQRRADAKLCSFTAT